jgi:hypothetical protein
MDSKKLQTANICRFCLTKKQPLLEIFRKYEDQQADLAHQVVSVVSLEVIAPNPREIPRKVV